ncbi:MAG: hypothetical protein ACLFRI_06735, partial [Candidatus Izemoplasmataceae bacterium]
MGKKKLILTGSYLIVTVLFVISYITFSVFDITSSDIKKYELEIVTEGAEKLYDGSPLSNEEWSIKSGKLEENHALSVTMTSSITKPGSIANEIGVTITDENNNIITDNYDITYDLGDLVVRPIELTIETKSMEKEYDGVALSLPEHVLTGTLFQDHEIQTLMTSTITTPGSIDNAIEVTILDESNEDVTDYYLITYEIGSLTVHPRQLVVETSSEDKVYNGEPLVDKDWIILSGTVLPDHQLEASMNSSITNPGSIDNNIGLTIIDSNNQNVTSFYDITYEYGTLIVFPRHIHIETASKEKLYDGLPLSHPEWELQSGALLSNHTIDMVMPAEITNPGSVENTIRITIFDEDNQDVTSYYDISLELGMLTVNPNYITIATESAEKLYDGTPLSHHEWHIIDGVIGPTHTIEAVMFSEITLPGSTENLIGITIVDELGNDVTNIYHINYDIGILTVQPQALHIKTGEAEKDYDGTPLSNEEWSIQSGSLFDGHHIVAVMNTSITNPGYVDNTIGITILDEFDNDVTHVYQINKELGKLIVRPIEISIKTNSAEKYYDGNPLSEETWTIQSGALLEGHHIETVMNATITNPGSINNTIGITILDEQGIDVTNMYLLNVELGFLTVKHLELTI